MKTLQVSDETARKIYPGAASELKAMLEETFGIKFFSQKITDRIKTFNDACLAIGITNSSLSVLNSCDELRRDMKSLSAYLKLIIICRALNEGWEPDWNNSNQAKWWPYFKKNSAGFGFSYANYDFWDTFTSVGSRLCFKSEELAKYAATQFESEYNDFIILEK